MIAKSRPYENRYWLGSLRARLAKNKLVEAEPHHIVSDLSVRRLREILSILECNPVY